MEDEWSVGSDHRGNVAELSLNARRTVYCVLCTVYCVLCAVCCVLCAVCCVLCAVCCVLCAVRCVLPRAVDHGLQAAGCRLQCRLWTVD